FDVFRIIRVAGFGSQGAKSSSRSFGDWFEDEERSIQASIESSVRTSGHVQQACKRFLKISLQGINISPISHLYE
ncbi:MAG TPA: hypothetical protein VN670_09060, partial [Acidobacteriaceae bacterium]|nr:hypothetical protein [Acidobacteriaceae bacterium]